MKLNYKRTFYVGFAFFLICTFWQAYDTIVPKILTDKFGLNQTWSGAVMALDNIFALFLLPLFGTLSDKCKSKMGRRSPFILVGTVIAVIAFMLMSVADNVQLKKINAASPTETTAQAVLYENVDTFKTPEGEEINLKDKYTLENYCAIPMYNEDGDVTEEYTNYVVSARRAYAAKITESDPSALIFFVAMLLLALLSMSTFRSPAVALMPDVTVKPLRSKANAIINLMGAVGGIIVLVLGTVFSTGSSENSLMSYTVFFGVIAFIMVLALVLFFVTVRENRFVREMEQESAALNISEDEPEEKKNGKLSKAELSSLVFILASVVLWYMGYNAVTSKYSVYASAILNLDYNLTLTIASAAAIVSYIPIGNISSKIGRKKMIIAGVVMLAGAFGVASFMRSESPLWLMNILFALAGIGWAAINVNSYPMVVELSGNGDVGKYTGFYYTASMAAQTATPIISGFFMDIKMTSLFVYATVCVALAVVTMAFVRKGDSVPKEVK